MSSVLISARASKKFAGDIFVAAKWDDFATNLWYQTGEFDTTADYERLLLDALKGDASLFARSDGIRAAWHLIDPILQGWSSPEAPPLAVYDPSSWGPAEAETLLARDGRAWQLGCGEH